MSKKYKITSLPKEGETQVDFYGAIVGDLVQIDSATSDVWLKGSNVFREGNWSKFERLCVADSMSDLLKYVEEVK